MVQAVPIGNQEIEVKLALLDPTRFAHWCTTASLTPAFALGEPATVTHVDTYIDSTNYHLLRRGYTLRLRWTGKQWLVTLKTLNLNEDALVHQRLELEGPVAMGSNPLHLKHWPKHIRQFVSSLIGAEAHLQPFCTLQQTRHKREVLAPMQKRGAKASQASVPFAELSVDQVVVYGPELTLTETGVSLTTAEAQPITEFQELEVELKPGATDDRHVALLNRLAQVLTRQRELKPNQTSKLERALQAIGTHVYTAAGYQSFMQAAQPIAEACRLLWREQLTQILLTEAGVRYSTDIEYIHDMRVAIRRARVAARLFGDYFEEKAIKRFQKRLKQTARHLGVVRDLDVALEKLSEYEHGQLTDEQPHEPLPKNVAGLAKHWREERAEAHQALLTWLDSPEYTAFIEKFVWFCQTPDEGARHFAFVPGEAPTPYQVRHVVPSLLVNRFECVRCFETLFETDEPIPAATLHLLRIECKYMRYSLEFTRHLLGQRGELLIGKLKQLQEDLGALNDAVVTLGKLDALPARVKTTAVDQYAESQATLMATLQANLTQDFQAFLALPSRRLLSQAIIQV